MSLLDDILDNQIRDLDNSKEDSDCYGDPDEACCYKCNLRWTVEEICAICEKCPDCCECER